MIGALVAIGIVGIIIFAVTRRGREDVYELPPRVVDTPTAGTLSAEEREGFMPVCVEIIARVGDLLEGFEEIEELLEDDRGVEAAERYAEMEEALEELPEIAGQGDEFRGGSEEPRWWSTHIRELAERLLEAEQGKIASAAGGQPALGAVEVAFRILAEMALACDDFARRMLGFDVVEHVKRERGKEAAKGFKESIAEAKANLE